MAAAERRWVIYTLSDPKAPDVVRYVGATHTKPATRLAQHVNHARRRQEQYHSARWVRSLDREGLRPVIEIVEEGSGKGWEEAERRWIALHRDKGSPLTNHAKGGRGPVGCIRSPETRAKLAAANRGKKQSPELVEKRISAIRGKTHTAQSKANMSAGKKGKPWTPAVAEAQAAAWTDERRKKISESNKETYARRKTAGVVKTRKGFRATDETREKLRASHLGQKPSPETRAKRSASMKAAWARRKAAGIA